MSKAGPESRGEAPDVVFVVGPAGNGGPILARALASLAGCTVLPDEPAPAVNLGTQGDRRGPSVSPAGRGRVRRPVSGLVPVDGLPRRSLQVPHLDETYAEPRFVLCRRDPLLAMSRAHLGWRSELEVSHPELEAWSGPPWSFALIAGWQKLEGADLGTIVARQWAAVTTQLAADLGELKAGRWTDTSYSALVADPAGELRRLCAALGIGEAGLERAAAGLRDDLANEPAFDEVPPELEPALAIVEQVDEQARALVS